MQFMVASAHLRNSVSIEEKLLPAINYKEKGLRGTTILGSLDHSLFL